MKKDTQPLTVPTNAAARIQEIYKQKAAENIDTVEETTAANDDEKRKIERKKEVFPESQIAGSIDIQKEVLPATQVDSQTGGIMARKTPVKKEKVLMAQLSIKMPESLDRRLERYCFENDLKKQEVMATAIERVLSEEGY